MGNPTDAELLAGFLGGDTGAFEALVQRHQGALLRHARSLLGDARTAEDVVQEAFLRLAQKPPRPRPRPGPTAGDGQGGEGDSSLTAWLHRVTRNCCMDALRSETRRRKREEEAATGEATSGGLREVEENDTREAVERGLGKLPSDQREVLVLRLLDDKSYREIASITGKKIGTVSWLISVGLKELSRELAPLLSMAPAQPPHARMGDGARVSYLQGEA